MSGVRVEVVTPCEHGHLEPHVFIPGAGSYPPGATNLTAAPWEVCWNHRTFTEWPPEAIEAAARGVWERNNDGNWFQHKQLQTGSYLAALHDAQFALAAAWETLTGDNK